MTEKTYKSNKAAVIASLFPAKLPSSFRTYAPLGFIIPECKDMAKPAYLVIEDQTDRPYMGLGRNAVNTVPADQVAHDIIREVVNGLPGSNEAIGAIPAVWVSEGARILADGSVEIPQAEIDHHRKGQEELLRQLVIAARWLHSQKQEQAILPIMHTAAAWLHVTGEEWQKELHSDSNKECPYCTTSIKRSALVCPSCRNIVDTVGFKRQRDAELRMEEALDRDEDVPLLQKAAAPKKAAKQPATDQPEPALAV